MKRLSALFLIVAACSRPASDAPKKTSLSAVDSTITTVCGTTFDTIPFKRVDLGPARTTPAKQSSAKELIQTSAEWAKSWAAFGDSMPAPTLNFTDSIVVFVASGMFDAGPSSLEIESAGKCTGIKDIVVPVRLHSASTSAHPERSIRAIQIAKSDWKNQRITFIDMPPISDKH
jgi:hypothetical protein